MRQTVRLVPVMMMTVSTIVSISGPATVAGLTCPSESGCNRPRFKHSTLTIAPYAAVGSNEITYRESENFPSNLKQSVETGIDMAQKLLGKVSGVSVFLYESQSLTAQDASAYTDIDSAWCEATRSEITGYCSNDSTNREKAMAGTNNVYASHRDACQSDCGKGAVGAVPMVITSGLQEDGTYYDDVENQMTTFAIHEYTHAFQMHWGKHIPTWLMEGGAVFLEAVFSNDNSRASRETFSGYFNSHILPNVRDIYSDQTNFANWLTKFGSDRKCGDSDPHPPPNIMPNEDVGDAGYYKVGALAVAFAINKANANYTANGGRTFIDFWTSTVARKGFWHSIDVVDNDYVFDDMVHWPSEVPEGKGWKKALCDFTGYATVEAFYADFEEFVAPNGEVKSAIDLAAILESDDSVDSLRSEFINAAATTSPNACEAAPPPPPGLLSVGSAATFLPLNTVLSLLLLFLGGFLVF